jgi:hypothetical protein
VTAHNLLFMLHTRLCYITDVTAFRISYLTITKYEILRLWLGAADGRERSDKGSGRIKDGQSLNLLKDHQLFNKTFAVWICSVSGLLQYSQTQLSDPTADQLNPGCVPATPDILSCISN